MEALFAFALAFVPIAGIIAFLSLPRKKRKYGWLAVAAYVAIYFPLSLTGRFQTSNHGGMNWRDEWLPRAGNLFWPLIILDNLIWHSEHESGLSAQ